MGILDDIDRILSRVTPPNFRPGYSALRNLGPPVARTGWEIGKELFNPFNRFDIGPGAKWKYPPSDPRGMKQGRVLGSSAGAAQEDPLGSLYQQLLEMLTSPAGVDEGALMAQVRGQLDPIYDERIATAERTTERGQEDISGAYGALAADYERLAPEQAAQAAEAQEDVSALYNQLRSNIEGNYSRISQEQGDLFKQLGIEEAAPEVLNPQAEQAAQATTAAEQLGASQQQRYTDIGNIDETYYREGSPLSKLVGSNRVSDLAFELQNYVGQTEAERSSAIQQAFTSLQQQALSRSAQQQSSQQQMLWEILMSQLEAQQPGELTADSFLAGLQPQVQGEVASAFRQLERSPEAVTGRQELAQSPVPGTFVNLTDEWWYDQVDQMAARGEISDATRQALIFYLRLRNQ